MSTPTSLHPLRWGILGTGTIAKAFARGLAHDPGSRLAAVGSRSAGSAAAFAGEFPCRAHGDYAALCADPEVDVVYIASPHQAHREHALLAIAHGKPVLVEKPFALNRREAAEIFAAARAHGVFCMEAMWTRCLPAHRQVAAWLAAGAIGEVRMVRADFGFRAAWDPASRLLSPALAGGALLDVGVYVVAFSLGALGRAPQRIQAGAFLGKTGVDEQAAVLLGWDDGALATLTCAVRTATRHDAVICGTEGRIEIPDFWHAAGATLVRPGAEPEVHHLPFVGNGYVHEAQEVADCLRAGRLESPRITQAQTLEILDVLDTCRRQIGLAYPGETAP